MSVMRVIKLTEAGLLAELRTALDLEDGAERVLWFICPLCREHMHRVPFAHDEAPGVWKLERGLDLHDLSLTPSYVAKTPRKTGECRLHAFIKKGELQILADSKAP